MLEIVVGVLDADGPLNTRKLVSGTATIVHLAALESHSFPLLTHSLSLSLARSLALFLSLSFFLSNFLHHQTIDFAVFIDFRRKTRVERMRNTVMVMRKDRNHREVKRYGTVPESHFRFSHE